MSEATIIGIGRIFQHLPQKVQHYVADQVFPTPYCYENLPIGSTDICFVFGGGSEERVKVALNLYRERRVRKILLTGGIGPLSKDRITPEAISAAEFLMAAGVPAEDLIIESRSQNTIENIEYGLNALGAEGYVRDFSCTCVTDDYHLRRAVGLLWTAVNRHPAPSIYWYATVDPTLTRPNWQADPRNCFIIFKEFFRLRQMTLSGKIRFGTIKPKF